MKIMISQPMRGKTEEQIRNERAEIVKQLEEDGYEVIDSILDLEEGKSPIYYLSKSIELLDQADKVFFMNGWMNARGCRIEHRICKEYGKKTIYEDGYKKIKSIK